MEKIIGFLLLRKSMSDSGSLIVSLLAGMAAVAVLTLVAGLLFCVLLLGSIYTGYYILLSAGVAPLTAALILGGILLCSFIICTIAILTLVKRISRIPRRVTGINTPFGDQIGVVVDSFIDGFNTPPLH